MDAALAEVASQGVLADARQQAIQRPPATPAPAPAPDGDGGRRRPPRPSWMGDERQASTASMAAMAELRRFQRMRPAKSGSG